MPNRFRWEVVQSLVCRFPRREVLSQNRYGSVATRRTLRVGRVTVNPALYPAGEPFSPARTSASVQVRQATARIRLGVLHAT